MSESMANNRSENDRKIFCGGLSKCVTDQDLKEYFGEYGPIQEVNLKMDNYTKQSRGFGFVVFESKESLDKALCCHSHQLKGKKFEAKQAEGPEPLLKVFAGGLPRETNEEEVRAHFEQYGNITNLNLAMDKVTKKFRGFAFVTYENEDMADAASVENKHIFCGKKIDVKKALPEAKVQQNRGSFRDYKYGGGFPQNSGYGYGGGSGYEYYDSYNDGYGGGGGYDSYNSSYSQAPYDDYDTGYSDFNSYGSGFSKNMSGGYHSHQSYPNSRGRYHPY